MIFHMQLNYTTNGLILPQIQPVFYKIICRLHLSMQPALFWLFLQPLSMGCKKDIFGSFAYEFELSQFLVKSFAFAHGEIKGLRLW